MIKPLILASILLLAAACVAEQQQRVNLSVGDRCVADSQCVTPMDYLMRSVCPYSSHCIEGSCRVTCMMYRQAVDPSVSASTLVACKTSADCDCSSYIPDNAKSCECINGGCGVIVE
jgi:hypothetical protein